MKLWNKIVVGFLIALIIFIILGILYYNGYLDNTNWTTLAMIGAAAAGPYIAIKKWLLNKVFSSASNDRIRESEDQYLKLRKQETDKRSKLNLLLSEKDKEIDSLRKEVNILNIDLKHLQEQRAAVKSEVNKLSTDELLEEFNAEF